MQDSPLHTEAASKKPLRFSFWRWAVSALLILHLTAVFVSPFAFISSSPGTVSPVATAVSDWFRPYVELTYLNHGYAFFAPNPGPSHLVRYELKHEDNRVVGAGTFPSLSRHWPRLLYHRHFMLSEQLHSDSVPPHPPQAASDVEYNTWRRRRDVYEAKLKSYENHLSKRYGANQVRLVRVEHQQPNWVDVLVEGKPLDADDLFRDLPDGTDALPQPMSSEMDSRESESSRAVTTHQKLESAKESKI